MQVLQLNQSVQIEFPERNPAFFHIESCSFTPERAVCAVIKDAGDDPDVTDGAEIRAEVAWRNEPGIGIAGGEGVGMVTKPGLDVPVGMPAINNGPRRMITGAVTEAMPGSRDHRGLNVTVSVPRGRELARKTLNKRLGIIGGISILGTTGVVIPYSIDAYKASIAQAVDIAVASGCRQAVLTTGRRSEKYAQGKLQLAEECFIQAGDFIDYALEQCLAKGILRVTIWGMTGKISKLAAGYLYTNISDSRVDINFLADVAAGCGVPEEQLGELKKAVTANQVRRLLPAHATRCFCDRLCWLAAEQCEKHTGNKVAVNCIMSDYDGVLLGESHGRV